MRAMWPVRLRSVVGYEARANDVLFHPAAARPPPPHQPQTLVYFGGDVQDYPEIMAKHSENSQYLQWNLERTARLLSRHFPHKHVLVVRPSRIEFQTISCYDNFVSSNSAGVPAHSHTHHALTHLERLLQEVSTRLKTMDTSELLNCTNSEEELDQLNNGTSKGETSATVTRDEPGTVEPLWWVAGLCLARSRLTLVGFSKGCVVLNQIAHEFHHHTTLGVEENGAGLLSNIECMYWLDGGHAGGKHTWLTDTHVLHSFATQGIGLFVHVSPYQVEDRGRPWIGREEKIFTALLTKHGAQVSRYLHRGEGPPSLFTHFSVLDNFKRVQDEDASNNK